MHTFKRFVFPLFKSILLIIFVFKGSEAIFRELVFPASKAISNSRFSLLLNLDEGRLLSRFVFFSWTVVLYLFIELLLSKHKFHQTIIFQSKHKTKAFFKGSILGCIFAFVLLIFLLLFRKIEFVGIEANRWKIIFGTFASIISILLIAFSLELAFRGFILKYLSQHFNAHVAVFISAVLYGTVFVQKISPYYPVMQFLTGILLGYFFIFYGFYFSFGAHFAWKFFEAFFLDGSVIYTLIYPFFKSGGASISPQNFFGSVLAAIAIGVFFIVFRKRLLPKIKLKYE